MMPQSADSVQPPFPDDSLGLSRQSVSRPTISHKVRPGKAYLVGAGPGAPGLITVRGQQCLSMADVVLYDGLANEQLLEMAPQAETICVGKHGQSPIWTQSAINRKLLELVDEGKVVVRLKGGDPAVFARTAEELEALTAAHVDFEVVPGITAALAAASYAGIPITHREHASAVAFVTGQQQSTTDPQEIDWEALARFPGTLVFYMGVTTVAEWTGQLLRCGKDPATPAAIVRRCTWNDQTVIRCTLADIAAELTPSHRLRPPVIVIVGQVAALGGDFDWFSNRPLHGCGVLITRAEHQSHDLAQELRQLGAEVYLQPVIQVQPPQDTRSLDEAIESLVQQRAQGITFSSVNGVEAFLGRLWQLGRDARLLANVRIATVGPVTAAQLNQYGLRADVVTNATTGYSAQGLLQVLGNSVDGERWIVTTTNRSRDELRKGLESHGASTLEALCYETLPVQELRPTIRSALESQRVQFVTISSRAIGEASAQLLRDFQTELQPISLSPSVSQALEAMGWPANIQASQNTSQSMVDALVHHWKKQRQQI